MPIITTTVKMISFVDHGRHSNTVCELGRHFSFWTSFIRHNLTKLCTWQTVFWYLWTWQTKKPDRLIWQTVFCLFGLWQTLLMYLRIMCNISVCQMEYVKYIVCQIYCQWKVLLLGCLPISIAFFYCLPRSSAPMFCLQRSLDIYQLSAKIITHLSLVCHEK